jgi:hypothetical protein
MDFVSREEAERDIAETTVTTARRILAAAEKAVGDKDVSAHMDIMASLSAFVGSLRDAYGIKAEPGSFAEQYTTELKAKNYVYVFAAHTYIISSLREDLKNGAFWTLPNFLNKPAPKFK